MWHTFEISRFSIFVEYGQQHRDDCLLRLNGYNQRNIKYGTVPSLGVLAINRWLLCEPHVIWKCCRCWAPPPLPPPPPLPLSPRRRPDAGDSSSGSVSVGGGCLVGVGVDSDSDSVADGRASAPPATQPRPRSWPLAGHCLASDWRCWWWCSEPHHVVTHRDWISIWRGRNNSNNKPKKKSHLVVVFVSRIKLSAGRFSGTVVRILCGFVLWQDQNVRQSTHQKLNVVMRDLYGRTQINQIAIPLPMYDINLG